MSHKCVRCGSIYEDNDSSILRGCKCGSIFFLFTKTQQDVKEFQDIQQELQNKDTTLEQELSKSIEQKKEIEKEQIEKDVKAEVSEIHAPREIKKEIIEEGIKDRKKFGIETVRITKGGVYEINIDALMKRKPLIILEKGKIYLIHLPSAFERFAKE